MSVVSTALFDATAVRLVRYPAADLDCSGAWLFWQRDIESPLRQSLEAQGQLVPVLIDGSGGRPVLIAGAARVTCLAELGRDVLCVDLGSLGARDKGLVYVNSNFGLEVSETRLVAALRYFAGMDGDMDDVFPVLGVEPRSKTARLAMTWLALPGHWDAALARGALPLACAEQLAAFDAGDLIALEALFARLSWSRGNAANVLTWLREICLRDGLPVREIMAGMGVAEILAADLSPKDTMARLTQTVRRSRFPELTCLERGFSELSRLACGTRWRITQPDQFESDSVEFTVRVSGRTQLEQAARDLTDIAARDVWGAFFPRESR